jgi:uncharacterized membrane protein YgcG
MVLRALGVAPAECSLKALSKQVPTTTTWTVDLAYLMRAYGVQFRYCTRTVGVDSSYKNKEFYKDTLDEDTARVMDLFSKAEEHQLVIEHRTVSPNELVELLRVPQQNMVMTLVDRRYLYNSSWIGRAFSGASGFVGHYVLLVGYDAVRDGYYLHDPGRTPEPEFASSSDLHRARVAHGTDEDLIIIPWEDNHAPARMLRRAQKPDLLLSDLGLGASVAACYGGGSSSGGGDNGGSRGGDSGGSRGSGGSGGSSGSSDSGRDARDSPTHTGGRGSPSPTGYSFTPPKTSTGGRGGSSEDEHQLGEYLR